MAKNNKMSERHRQFLKYTSMTTKELAEATKEFDQEFVADTFGPPTPEAAALMRRARRKVGRPIMGKGVKVISVSVEKDLLVRSDALARRLKIHRAQLIARGLQAVLAAEAKR
jgi:hypothetical protein